MTPERKAYAEKRIKKLTEKLNRINNLIGIRAHSGNPQDQKDRVALRKEQASTSQAIKRWQKELQCA